MQEGAAEKMSGTTEHCRLEKRATSTSFSDAPYVHPFNQPKYHALFCHAWQYAKNHKKQVLWCLAQAWPLTLFEESISSEELQRLRESLFGHT